MLTGCKSNGQCRAESSNSNFWQFKACVFCIDPLSQALLARTCVRSAWPRKVFRRVSVLRSNIACFTSLYAAVEKSVVNVRLLFVEQVALLAYLSSEVSRPLQYLVSQISRQLRLHRPTFRSIKLKQMLEKLRFLLLLFLVSSASGIKQSEKAQLLAQSLSDYCQKHDRPDPPSQVTAMSGVQR